MIIKPRKAPDTPNRSLASNRWSLEEDDRLLELVNQQVEWSDIAKAMMRTFGGVQHRFRYLKNSRPDASAIVARISSRAQDQDSAPDLTCGAISNAGRRLVEAVKSHAAKFFKRPKTSSGPLTETDVVIGALLRELMLLRDRDAGGWLRVTVSRIKSSEHGIGMERFCHLLNDLEKCGLVERFVGYSGTLTLSHRVARQGRFVQIRASSRLIELCRNQRILACNIFTHFPSLGG